VSVCFIFELDVLKPTALVVFVQALETGEGRVPCLQALSMLSGSVGLLLLLLLLRLLRLLLLLLSLLLLLLVQSGGCPEEVLMETTGWEAL
jgi:hypothetical protein